MEAEKDLPVPLSPPAAPQESLSAPSSKKRGRKRKHKESVDVENSTEEDACITSTSVKRKSKVFYLCLLGFFSSLISTETIGHNLSFVFMTLFLSTFDLMHLLIRSHSFLIYKLILICCRRMELHKRILLHHHVKSPLLTVVLLLKPTRKPPLLFQ